MMLLVLRSSEVVAARWASSMVRSSGVMGNVRPSLFLVVPTSGRTMPALEVDLAPLQRQDLALESPTREVGERRWRPSVLGQVSAHRLELLALEESTPGVVLPGHLDVRHALEPLALHASENIRLSAANSRLIVAAAAPSPWRFTR
jgi:hypothetical protein